MRESGPFDRSLEPVPPTVPPAVPPTNPMAVPAPSADDVAPTLDVPAPGAPPPARDAADPRRWLGGRFEVVRELGRGGMGVVFQARDAALGRDVAVKTFLPGASFSRTTLERFEREAQLTAALSHPGIVRVYAAGNVEGRPWIAYEMVEGARTLAQVLRGVDRPTSLRLLLQVARAVAHAHARGVTHRDLKPDNVLVDPDGRPRVADFGLAAGGDGQDGITRSGDLLGTPTHMAPEQFEYHRGGTGPHTDVWALGVMLYERLAGRLPFGGKTVAELGKQVTTADPAPPGALREGVPAALQAVCLRALARDPAARQRDAGAFADDLEAALEADRRRARGLPAVVVGLVGAAGLVGLGVAAGVAHLARRPVAERAAAPPPALPARVAAEAPGGPPPWFAALPADRRPALPQPKGLRFGEGEGEYVNVADGSPLVWIPPGTAVVGKDGHKEEQPEHPVRLTSGYFIGKHEVTAGQYRRFCQATRRAPPEALPGATDDHPVVRVTLEEARAYCAWASGRLPTEAEWERAARGEDGREFPWGDDLDLARRANTREQDDGFTGTAPVGSFPLGASPFGALDMAGNAFEWVEGEFDRYPPDGRLEVDPEPLRRDGASATIRGGAYQYSGDSARAWNRTPMPAHMTDAAIGFRLARSAR